MWVKHSGYTLIALWTSIVLWLLCYFLLLPWLSFFSFPLASSSPLPWFQCGGVFFLHALLSSPFSSRLIIKNKNKN